MSDAATLDLLDSALQNSPADQTEILLVNTRTAVTRYANSEIHQNVLQDDLRAVVRVAVNGAVARVFSGATDLEGLRGAIENAVSLARRQPPNPNFISLPAPGSGTAPDGPAPQTFFDSTAALDPERRAEMVGQVIDLAASEDYLAYGVCTAIQFELTVANSLGIREHASSTTAYLKALVESAHGSGFADALDRDAARIDPEAVARQAVAKCRANRNQIELPPGDYMALFEPNAVADMVRFPAISGMGARQVRDGASFMSGKLGQQVTGANVSIWDDPRDPRCMPFPIDWEGLPSTRVSLIDKGVAVGPVYDSETAARQPGQRSTGHAPSPFWYDSGPQPEHIVMPEGVLSNDDLLAQVERGVLVTRFHYTHGPDPKRVLATGTTRDGTFLIEDGRITAAVKNMRFGMSVLDLLGSTKAAGRGRTVQDWWAMNGMGSTVYFLPPLLFESATFTGVTTF